MPVKISSFDLAKAIPYAWEVLWANNLKERKKDEAYAKKHGKKPYNWAKTYYLTASDVENQVREFAAATRDGKQWKDAPIAYGKPMTWPPLRITTPGCRDLLGMVRDWLLRDNGGKIVSHNFGKGHISGARFRPAGEPLAEAEKETYAARERRRNTPRPIHSKGGKFGMLCRKKPTSPFARGRHRNIVTETASKVTCKQCLNLLAKMPAKVTTLRDSLEFLGSINHMPDDNTH